MPKRKKRKKFGKITARQLRDKRVKQDLDTYRTFMAEMLPADKADLIERCNRLDPQLLFFIVGGACGTTLELLNLSEPDSYFSILDPTDRCYSCFKAMHFQTYLRPKDCLARGELPSAWIAFMDSGLTSRSTVWVVEQTETGLVYHQGLFQQGSWKRKLKKIKT